MRVRHKIHFSGSTSLFTGITWHCEYKEFLVGLNHMYNKMHQGILQITDLGMTENAWKMHLRMKNFFFFLIYILSLSLSLSLILNAFQRTTQAVTHKTEIWHL